MEADEYKHARMMREMSFGSQQVKADILVVIRIAWIVKSGLVIQQTALRTDLQTNSEIKPVKIQPS